MPDATHALVPLSGKHFAMSLTNEHYDETKQWRDHNGGEAKISPFQTKLAKVSATDVTGNMIFIHHNSTLFIHGTFKSIKILL